jgi:hypothetical protein
MHLTRFYDFIQVLHNTIKTSTKNEYFYKHIQFTIIYLQLEQKFTPNNYYEQRITVIYFIQANGHYLNMHANIQGMNMYEIL